jgi:tetratricopeptide (TPR) repeat protein
MAMKLWKNADNSGDKIIKIKILGIVGNTYQSLQLNEKTRVYLDQAESLLSSAKASDSLNLVKGNIYYLKGMNYFYSLDSDIALSYFNKAINQYLLSKNSLAEIISN